jgi:multidrug efflux pump subunit AcrA (membrane-fusion protein)
MFSSFSDKKLVGRADAIGDVVDPVTRTVKVRVTMRDVHGKFLPGMFARIDFGHPISGLMTLPPSARETVEEKDYVFVETEPRVFERRQMTIASSTSSEVVILKGLENGERIVTSGAILLKGLSFGF